jgi:hypothetical protein
MTHDGERIARLEEQHRSMGFEVRDLKELTATNESEIKTLVRTVSEQGIHIGIMQRVVYGMVGMVLLSVGTLVISQVVK